MAEQSFILDQCKEAVLTERQFREEIPGIVDSLVLSCANGECFDHVGPEPIPSREAVVDIVKQALSEKARQRREIFLRVNPEDLQHIRENKPALLEVLSRAKEIGIREDPDVAVGGAVIETDAGIIDAQLETQLAVFERVLKEVR